MADTPTLQSFYNELTTNGVRLQHQFRLTFQVPVDFSFPDVRLYAKSATVPALRQNKAAIPYYAYNFQLPTNFEMDQEWQFDILCDANMEIRARFLEWAGLHSNFNIEQGGSGQGVKQTPHSSINISVDLLDNDLVTAIDTYTLVGCFPTNIGAFNTTHDSANPITFPVTITYQYFKCLHGMPQGPQATGASNLVSGIKSVIGGAGSLASAIGKF